MKHGKNEGREEGNGREERVGEGKEKEGGGKGERKFFPRIGPRVLRTSMQVLIKRIQKRGASPFVWRCGRGSSGGVNLGPSIPCALRRFCLVSTFYHWAAELHSCTSTSGEAVGSKWGRGLSGTQLIFSPSPPLSHVNPKPSQLPLTGKVINFIYTLIRLLDLSLWLLEVGVKGLWGSSQELMLRFSHLIASRLGKRSRQNRLEAVPSLWQTLSAFV